MDLVREWKWCESKGQRICDEVCLKNLQVGKCIRTKKGCKVKPDPMSEEDKARLQTYSAKRDLSQKGLIRGKTPELCEKLRNIGAKKAAIKLYLEKRIKRKVIILKDISENTVKSWIKRGNVPSKYREMVQTL